MKEEGSEAEREKRTGRAERCQWIYRESVAMHVTPNIMKKKCAVRMEIINKIESCKSVIASKWTVYEVCNRKHIV